MAVATTAVAAMAIISSPEAIAQTKAPCKVLEMRNHDSGSYTQGFFFHEGKLYESAGQYGESSLRIVDPQSGRVLKRKNFDRKYFLEGSCICNGLLYVLTWQENTCFVCNPETLETIGQLRYNGEGWGLTTDGKSLIMSDGSATLRWRNPANFAIEKELKVKLKGKDLRWLNELEYIGGVIWANVYFSDTIVLINPDTGEVIETKDCKDILPRNLRRPSTDVLNGIAYTAKDSTLWITGKLWPRMFRIEK